MRHAGGPKLHASSFGLELAGERTKDGWDRMSGRLAFISIIPHQMLAPSHRAQVPCSFTARGAAASVGLFIISVDATKVEYCNFCAPH